MVKIVHGPMTREEEAIWIRKQEEADRLASHRDATVALAMESGLELLRERSKRMNIQSPTGLKGTPELNALLTSLAPNKKPFYLQPEALLSQVYGFGRGELSQFPVKIPEGANATLHNSLRYLFLPDSERGFTLPGHVLGADDLRVWPLSADLIGKKKAVPPRGDRHTPLLTKLNQSLEGLHPDLRQEYNRFAARFTIGKVMLSRVLAPAVGGIPHDGWRLAAFGPTSIDDAKRIAEFSEYPHRIYLLIHCKQSVEPYPRSTAFYDQDAVDIDGCNGMLGFVTHANPKHPIDFFVVSRSSSRTNIYRPNGGLKVDLVDPVKNQNLYLEALGLLHEIADPIRRLTLSKGLGAGMGRYFEIPESSYKRSQFTEVESGQPDYRPDPAIYSS